MECVELGHIGNKRPLIQSGRLVPPYQFSRIMGVIGGSPATTRNLVAMVDNLPLRSIWESIVISHEQWSIVAAALSMGGNVRVGLEDNFYLDLGGTMAKSNAELVEKAARMARDAGVPPASVDEARAILELPPRNA